MIATETAKTVLLILFGLAILWIIIIVVRNDMETIVRALVVTALLGLGLYYVTHTKLESLSFQAIKEDLFPIKARSYNFHKRDTLFDGQPATAYVFDDPGPTLSLVLMEGGKYMAIQDIRTVNAVLKFIGLPPVEEGVPELASITHRGLDSDKFRWDNYQSGYLIIERGICRDMTTAETFTCIARITVGPR
jgi:hypothetical protein